MASDDPVHMGTLEQSGSVETDDGPKLMLKTDQGEFLLDADEKTQIDGLSVSVDHYLDDFMRGNSGEH